MISILKETNIYNNYLVSYSKNECRSLDALHNTRV